MYENITEHGILIVLSSPSGAGKTSLAASIVSENTNIVFSVSATTRLPRSGEIDGREYYFVDRPTFSRMIKNGDLLNMQKFLVTSMEPQERTFRNQFRAGTML